MWRNFLGREKQLIDIDGGSDLISSYFAKVPLSSKHPNVASLLEFHHVRSEEIKKCLIRLIQCCMRMLELVHLFCKSIVTHIINGFLETGIAVGENYL